MEEIRNKELFKMIAQGDQEAFAILYEENCKDIFAFAFSILNNYYDAEDVMQDVFVKVKLKAGGCSNFKNVNGWMIRVTKNQTLDFIRKKKEDLINNEMAGNFQSHGESVPQNTTIFMTEIFDELQEEERQIVILHLLSDLTHKTIAKALKLPLTTIKWRYRNAIRKLEKIAKKKEWEL